MRKYIIVFAILTCLSGCEQDRSFHGSFITSDDTDSLKIGKTTKQQVQKILGTPFMIANQNEWIYITKECIHKPFKENVTDRHQKYTVTFSNNGILENIAITDIKDPTIKFDSKDTRINPKKK